VTRISVVIVSHNSASVLGACLDSFSRFLPSDTEVVVVDNASADSSIDIAGARGISVLAGDVNLGFGAACNLGVAHTSGDWILISNPDIVIDAYDSSLLEAVARDLSVGAIAFDTQEVGLDSLREASAQPAHASGALRPFPHWWSGILTLAWGRILPASSGDILHFLISESPRRGLWASGALMAVPRSVWDAVGGFDQRFFLYFEDVDFSRRILQAGYSIGASSALQARHAHGGSSGKRDPALTSSHEAAGWLMYVRRWEGRRRAVIAAQALLANLWLARLSLGVFGPALLGERMGRKRAEIDRLAKTVRFGLRGATVVEAEDPVSVASAALRAG
jgi:N-acetylglucosaminyl-diphospho-decaprenol L-rhamnosyltransferase